MSVDPFAELKGICKKDMRDLEALFGAWEAALRNSNTETDPTYRKRRKKLAAKVDKDSCWDCALKSNLCDPVESTMEPDGAFVAASEAALAPQLPMATRRVYEACLAAGTPFSLRNGAARDCCPDAGQLFHSSQDGGSPRAAAEGRALCRCFP